MQYGEDVRTKEYFAFDDLAYQHFLILKSPSLLAAMIPLKILPVGVPYFHGHLKKNQHGGDEICWTHYKSFDPNFVHFYPVIKVQGSDPGDGQTDTTSIKSVNMYRVTQRRDNGTTYESQRDAYSIGDCSGDPGLAHADEIISIELMRRG